MFKVITEAANGYSGCSRRMAFQYARACRATGRRFLIAKRYGDTWRAVAEER